MLLQTNSYIVVHDKREEHARLMRRFRQALAKLGCDHFEVYEQVSPTWNNVKGDVRFVQVMCFRNRAHHASVEAGERNNPGAQELIQEFCNLIDFPYQKQQSLFGVGHYASVLSPLADGASPAQPVGSIGGAAAGEGPNASDKLPASEEQGGVMGKDFTIADMKPGEKRDGAGDSKST